MIRRKKKKTENSEFMVKKSHKREICNHNTYEYEGYTFKSGLELTTYKELQKSGLKFKYEETQFVLIDKIESTIDCYQPTKSNNGILKLAPKKLDSIKYTPDFIIYDDKGLIISYLEIKGRENEAFPIRWKLFKRYLTITKSNADVYIVKNKTQLLFAIDNIKKG